MIAKIDVLLVAASLLSGAGYVESSNYRTLDAPEFSAEEVSPSAEDCAAAAAEQAYIMMQMLAMEGAMWIEPSSREVEAWAMKGCSR